MQHIIILLDSSYSMYKYQEKVLYRFNECLRILKTSKDVDNIFLTIILFHTEILYLCSSKNVKNINYFTSSDLIYHGKTYLYDAIGIVFNDWLYDNNVKHKLYIITDGENVDNGSMFMNKEDITNMYNIAVNEYGWEIVFCNINISNTNILKKYQTRDSIDDINELFTNISI